jgi:excisionase family DNA binding protein
MSTQPLIELDRLWTANDVARYLQASRSWVYQKAESGALPCLRIGGFLRFEPEAIRDFARGSAAGSAVVESVPVRKRG